MKRKPTNIFFMKMDLKKLNRANKKECEKELKRCSRLVSIMKSFSDQGKPSGLFDTYATMYTDECNKISKHYGASRFFSVNEYAFKEAYGSKGIIGTIRDFANRFDN